jgi:hypothetical protein
MSKSTRALARALTVRVLTACALSACLLAFRPGDALAGRYHVYSCRTPTEQAAPADGWTASASVSSATVVARDTCATGGALVAGLGDGVRHEVGAAATWTFAAPSGESLVGATLWRAGDAEGGAALNATYDFQFAGPIRREVFSECVYVSKCTSQVGETEHPISVFNQLPVPSENLGGSLYMTAACGGLSGYLCPEGKNDPGGYAAVVYLYAADLILEQVSQPTVVPGSVGGELATASTVSGTASLTFSAEDAGSGVYRAVVSVDEKPVGATVLDSNGGRCADVGQTSDGLAAFLYLRPCAPAVSADVPLDTTTLADGTHHLVVTVTNAAGNSTVVLDRKIDVANQTSSGSGSTSESTSGGSTSGGSAAGGSTTTLSGASSALTTASAPASGASGSPPPPGAPNGTPATAQAILTARWRATRRATLVGRWGRAQAIAGRLTTAQGTPIADALVEAIATPSSQGAAARVVAGPRTDSAGRFSLRLPGASGSERVVLAYRAHLGDPLPAVTRTLTLSVPACLTLRVAPRVSHRGGTIAFTGLLRGPVPPGGKQLVLQARAPGAEWRTFQALSTDRRGRFRARYRFRLAGPIVYRFRVLSPREADFPFAAGRSNVVAVRER